MPLHLRVILLLLCSLFYNYTKLQGLMVYFVISVHSMFEISVTPSRLILPDVSYCQSEKCVHC